MLGVGVVRWTRSYPWFVNELINISVPDCTGGEWTPFINADAPGGNGDFETLWNARLVDPSICTNPIAADARLAKESIHWSVLGRGEVTNNGFVCKNTDYYHIPYLPGIYPVQDGSYGPTDDYPFYYQCDDYEVRFCCPKGRLFDLNAFLNRNF